MKGQMHFYRILMGSSLMFKQAIQNGLYYELI